MIDFEFPDRVLIDRQRNLLTFASGGVDVLIIIMASCINISKIWKDADAQDIF